jgi:hypothetical protein
LSKEEKAKFISYKLTTGAIGTSIQASLLTGGGLAATAVCTPLNIAAAACAPLGAVIGEAIYAQIPDLVDMIVRDDSKYDAVSDSGDKNTPPPRAGVYEGGSGDADDKGSNLPLMLIGGSIAGILLYNKFIKK